MSTFNCYSNIVILNPDNSINGDLNGFDYTQFDYLDLTAYDGEMYEKITNDEQLLARFTELEIEIEIKIEIEEREIEVHSQNIAISQKRSAN